MREIVRHIAERHEGEDVMVAHTYGYDLTYHLNNEGVQVNEINLREGTLLTGRSFSVVIINAKDLHELDPKVLVAFLTAGDVAYVYCNSGKNIGNVVRLAPEFGWRIEEIIKNRVFRVFTSDKKKKVSLSNTVDVPGEPNAVWFHLGGGIGDMIHHIACDEHSRALPQFRELFPDVKVHMYHNGPKIGAELASHLFDELHTLARPLQGPWYEVMMDNIVYMDKFIELNGCKISEIAAGPVSIPAFAHDPGYGKTWGWLANTVMLHPFVSYGVKMPCPASLWIDTIRRLIAFGYNVFVVGDFEVDRLYSWNRELIEYIESEAIPLTGLGRKRTEFLYSDPDFIRTKDSFATLVKMMQNTRALIAGDSAFRHAARYLEHPLVLLMNPDFYKDALSHMEEQPYDYNWHPEVRERRSRAIADVAPYGHTRVIWGTPHENNISAENVCSVLEELLTVSGLCVVPVPEYLADCSKELIEKAKDGFSLDQSKQWEIPACLDAIGKLEPGAKALDAGCGSSVLTRYLAEKGLKVVGLDSEEFEVDGWLMPKDAAKELGLDIEWKKLQIENMEGIKNGAFQYVFCISVIEHMTKAVQKKAIKELARVTGIGGYLAISWDMPYTYYDGEASTLPTHEDLLKMIPKRFTQACLYLFELEDSPYIDLEDMKKTIHPWCRDHTFGAMVFRRMY